MNVALYGPQARWAMTERERDDVRQSKDCLQIGPSNVRWAGDALEITIEERDKRLFNPFRRRVRGTVRVTPEIVNPVAFALDPGTKHRWHCLSPRARIDVDMEEPGLSWTGSAYLDSNFGSESLEEGFRIWHWSRAHCKNGAVVCYEGVRRDGSQFASALRFAENGEPEAEAIPAKAALPRSGWQVERSTRSSSGRASIIRTWEDTPFYSRSELATELHSEPVVAVQESLDLNRFRSPVVQFMLPYRMPRKD
ncbi:hydroxyneurosporene dehydrogenase [Altererythrobacter lutimaris]|nr:hydroxyneurosporene dehydrogenase [Altererythrobacter lutimaris]